MLICTQQSVGPSHWQDVDVPEDVTTVKEWQKKLVEAGVAGKFRATELDFDDEDDDTLELSQEPITLTFEIVQTAKYEARNVAE